MKNKDFIIYNNVLVKYLGTDPFVVIPEGVKEIASEAFFFKDDVYSVSIPKSVTKIQPDAFCECDRILEVINKSKLKMIQGSNNFGHLLINALIVNNTDDKSAMTFTNDGFIFISDGYHNQLVGYTKNENIVSLPEDFFGESYELGKYIFLNKKAIKIIIPKQVKGWDINAFDGMNRLTEILCLSPTILSSLSLLNNNELEPIYISQSIYSEPYVKITNDDFIYAEDDNIYLIDYIGEKENISLPQSINGKPYQIRRGSFNGNQKLVNVVLPEGLTYIDSDSFRSCDNLLRVTLPSTLNKIGKHVFEGGLKQFELTNLSNINLPETITKLFKVVNKKESAIFKHNDYVFGEFDDKYYLIGYEGKEKDIILPDNVNGFKYEICYPFFNNEIIETINLGKGISRLPSGSLQGINNIKSVFIPENILEIENSALPSNLKSVVIEESNPNYQSINNCVINKHTKELVSSCDSFIIPKGVLKIGGDSLSLSKLSKLEIPYGVTSIEELAFAFCEDLKEVTLPSTIKDVEYSAFLGADKLYNVYFEGTLEEWKKTNIESPEILRSNIYIHNKDNSYTLIHRFNDSPGLIYYKGHLSDIIKTLEFETTTDDIYCVEGTIKDIKFTKNKMKDISNALIDFDDGRCTFAIEIPFSDEVIDFYKENLLKGQKVKLTGKIYWKGYTYPIQFLQEEIEMEVDNNEEDDYDWL